MIAAHFHSADDVRDSIESLYQAHGSRRPIIYWLLLLTVAAAVICLPVIKVDVSVGAPGQVRPELERLPVISGIDGHVKLLAVTDNQSVHKGDTLLVLDSSAIDARIEQVRRLEATNADELNDLKLLIARTTPILELPTKNTSDRFSILRAQPLMADLPALRSAQYVRQLAVLTADVQRLLVQREQTQREFDRNRALHVKGLISDLDFDQQHFAVDRADREIELLIQQTLARWQAEKLDHEAKTDDLNAQAQQLAQQKELYIVRAPVDGTALGFTGLHAGLYLPAAQKLGEISPGGGLQADVYVSPKDVGFIRAGQRVNLQVDAFPYTEWGMLRGKVHDISQDYVQVGEQLAFRAVVDLDGTDLHSSRGVHVTVRRGMTVNARFILKKRTLFDILYGKMSDSFDPTARPSNT